MRVMGVDPGTHRTGFGVLESDGRTHKLVICGTVRTTARDPIARRLLHVFESLQKNIHSYKPDVVALEALFYAKDVRAVERIGEARACAMLAASKEGIEVIEYAPTAVKQSVTGNGRAAKEQVQFMVKKLLGLKEVPAPDASDALAIALCHIHSSKRNPCINTLQVK